MLEIDPVYVESETDGSWSILNLLEGDVPMTMTAADLTAGEEKFREGL